MTCATNSQFQKKGKSGNYKQLKRIPIVDEVVFIDYQDDTDVESIIFKGLPEEKIIDPRTTSYENKNKQRTRNSFATGA